MARLQCPCCKQLSEAEVLESRMSGGGHVKRRRRECQHCHRRFTTYEEIDYAALGLEAPAEISKGEQLRGIPVRATKPTAGEQIEFLADNSDIAEQFMRLALTHGLEIGRNYIYSQMGYRSF